MSSHSKQTMKDSVISSGIFLLLSATLVSPFVMISFWFFPLPFFILTVKQGIKVTSICGSIFAVLYVLLLHSLSILSVHYVLLLHPLSIFFVLYAVLVGCVMGIRYRKLDTSGTEVLMSGIVMILIVSWMLLIIGEAYFGLMEGLRASWTQSLEIQQEFYKMPLPVNQFPPIETFIPLMLLFVSFLMPFATLLTGRKILSRQGYHSKKILAFRDWRLPRVFFYFYVIFIIYSLQKIPDDG